MGARLDPRTLHHRCLRHGRARNDVRTARRTLQILGGADADSVTLHRRGQPFGSFRRAVPDQHLGDRPHGRMGVYEIGRQSTRADHQQTRSVGPGKIGCRKSGRGRGTPQGENPSVDNGQRHAGFTRQEHIDANDRGNRGSGIVRRHGDDLDALIAAPGMPLSGKIGPGRHDQQVGIRPVGARDMVMMPQWRDYLASKGIAHCLDHAAMGDRGLDFGG